MKKISTTLEIICCLVILFISTTLSAQSLSSNPTNSECLKCHQSHVSTEKYNASVHKSLNCTACHVIDGKQTKNSLSADKKTCVASYKPMDCASCHSTISSEYHNSVHNSSRLTVHCSQCHTEIHTIKSIKNNKIEAAKLCVQCHSKQKEYFNSTHYKSLLNGNKDAATCTDCHGLHSIKRIDNMSEGRAFHTQACLKCHGNEKMMQKNHVTNIATKTYFESYHGKNIRLGYPERVAGCADCHSAHNILPENDKHSTVNAANVQNTCRKCHANATEGFAKYLPHAEPMNHKKNPSLFWITIFMNGLMGVTFLFFWIHSLLWAFRGFVEKTKNRNNELFLNSKHSTKKAKNKVYKRFRTLHIILHLFVITSFLGLAVTGLPLKFNYTAWGKTIMDAFGGVETAGIIHRIGAIVTFGYFFVTLFMSMRFLFDKKKSNESFWKRLFGPDSLFPNLKDLRDIKAMFKWFFFKGPKPIFDRWTYWEKFDFMAVFWGVAIIGSSGLILWAPEFSGRFMPGWVFNIATIVHSDEALLAVGFIFTIHFFNTHLRAEKFPMDFVIFNGQITEEEMIEERGEQLKRYQEEGRLEEFKAEKPGNIFLEIVLRLFGFLAVLTGTILTLLILYTFFKGA